MNHSPVPLFCKFPFLPPLPSGPGSAPGSAPEGVPPRREALLGRRLKGGAGGFFKEKKQRLGAILLLVSFLFLSGCFGTKEAVKRDSAIGEGKYRIAVFPFENLSGTSAPIKDIRRLFIEKLAARGFQIVDEETLEKFMAKHRIRDTGGINTETARAFKKEIGVEGVLITSVELFSDASSPPKMALTSRLVSAGDGPTILWMDGVGMAGDDSPGLLSLGLIMDPKILLDKALNSLCDSLTQSVLTKRESVSTSRAVRKFRPKVEYRSPLIESGGKYTVAVIPFFNESTRKKAAEIAVLHFATELTKLGNFRVIELGVVKQRLLNARVIMIDGISLMDADLISNNLEADFVMTGRVMDYQDYQGAEGKPKVNFSVTVVERKSRKVVWNSYSRNEGDDGVYFFDWGKVNTAHAMMAEMAKAIGEMMTK